MHQKDSKNINDLKFIYIIIDYFVNKKIPSFLSPVYS